jgi:DNA-binding transcriptional ArsR family regulator
MEMQMRAMMDVLKALADENRVRVIMAVAERELCVCQITELLGLAQSTVSKHMAILKQARLVEARKEGRWIYYRAVNGEIDTPCEARAAIDMLRAALIDDETIRYDEKTIEHILKTDPEILCRKLSTS